MKWIVYICLGIAQGTAAVFAWNRMPPEWLCDYREEVGEKQRRKGLKIAPYSLLFAAVFTLFAAVAAEHNANLADRVLILSSLWILLLILVSDVSFLMIPDQLTLGVLGMGMLAGSIEILRGQDPSRMFAVRLAGGAVCAGLFLLLGGVSAFLCRTCRSTRLNLAVQIAMTKEKTACGAEPDGSALSCELENADDGLAVCGPEYPEGKEEAVREAAADEEPEAGFGMGDVKLLAALGVLLGPAKGLTVLAAASLLCGTTAAVLWIAGLVKAGEPHPFGPYLCVAAAAILLSSPISA